MFSIETSVRNTRTRTAAVVQRTRNISTACWDAQLSLARSGIESQTIQFADSRHPVSSRISGRHLPAGRPAVGGYRTAWHSEKSTAEKIR